MSSMWTWVTVITLFFVATFSLAHMCVKQASTHFTHDADAAHIMTNPLFESDGLMTHPHLPAPIGRYPRIGSLTPAPHATKPYPYMAMPLYGQMSDCGKWMFYYTIHNEGKISLFSGDKNTPCDCTQGVGCAPLSDDDVVHVMDSKDPNLCRGWQVTLNKREYK